MRCSIVGVAVNAVTRCASMASTARPASKRSSTTSRSPFSRLWTVEKALTWYIGASTNMIWGRATARHCAIIGVLKTSWHRAGRALTMIFGVPVDPLLQMPCIRSDTTSGRSGTSASAVPRIHGRSSSPRWTRAPITSRTCSSSQSGRSQRTGIGVAPSFQPREGGHHQLRRVRQPEGQPIAEAQAAGGEGAGQLTRPPVELGGGQDPFAAVQGDVGVDGGVGLLSRQLPQASDEADLLFFHDPPCYSDDDPVSMAPRRRTASRTSPRRS